MRGAVRRQSGTRYRTISREPERLTTRHDRVHHTRWALHHHDAASGTRGACGESVMASTDMEKRESVDAGVSECTGLGGLVKHWHWCAFQGILWLGGAPNGDLCVGVLGRDI